MLFAGLGVPELLVAKEHFVVDDHREDEGRQADDDTPEDGRADRYTQHFAAGHGAGRRGNEGVRDAETDDQCADERGQDLLGALLAELLGQRRENDDADIIENRDRNDEAGCAERVVGFLFAERLQDLVGNGLHCANVCNELAKHNAEANGETDALHRVAEAGADVGNGRGETLTAREAHKQSADKHCKRRVHLQLEDENKDNLNRYCEPEKNNWVTHFSVIPPTFLFPWSFLQAAVSPPAFLNVIRRPRRSWRSGRSLHSVRGSPPSPWVPAPSTAFFSLPALHR